MTIPQLNIKAAVTIEDSVTQTDGDIISGGIGLQKDDYIEQDDAAPVSLAKA